MKNIPGFGGLKNLPLVEVIAAVPQQLQVVIEGRSDYAIRLEEETR